MSANFWMDKLKNTLGEEFKESNDPETILIFAATRINRLTEENKELKKRIFNLQMDLESTCDKLVEEGDT